MIFGSQRDARLLLGIRKELIQDVIEQEILYWKIDGQYSQQSIYGESEEKWYWAPVKVNCLVTRGDQEWKVEDYGPDLSRKTTFAFIKDDLEDRNFKVEVGDIVEWQGMFFEIDGTKENQLFLGKDDDRRLDPAENNLFGDSISIVASTHLTRYTRLNITPRG